MDLSQKTEEPQKSEEKLGKSGIKFPLINRGNWMRASNMVGTARATVHYQGESTV